MTKKSKATNASKPKGSGQKQARAQAAPVAFNRSSQQNGHNSLRYRECERVLTVPGSVGFGIVGQVPLNPGISSSFPWLSGHANLYDKYKVHKLVFRYKNLKGTGSNGNILMSFDYDTLDPAPSSAISMTQSTRWIDGSPWRIFELHVPPDGRKLFTRSGEAAAADLKTYDMGRLWIAAEGCADTSDHGYLEVEYDIELFDKAPTQASPDQVALSQFNQSTTSSSNPLPFDEEIVNGLNLTNTAGVISGIPAGLYLITVDVTSSGTFAAAELQLNGAALTPPALITTATAGSGTLHRYVTVSSGDTIRFMKSTTSALADSCRLMLQRL